MRERQTNSAMHGYVVVISGLFTQGIRIQNITWTNDNLSTITLNNG